MAIKEVRVFSKIQAKRDQEEGPDQNNIWLGVLFADLYYRVFLITFFIPFNQSIHKFLLQLTSNKSTSSNKHQSYKPFSNLLSFQQPFYHLKLSISLAVFNFPFKQKPMLHSNKSNSSSLTSVQYDNIGQLPKINFNVRNQLQIQHYSLPFINYNQRSKFLPETTPPMYQTLSFLEQHHLVCPNSPVHRPLKFKPTEKENHSLISLERMLGEKKKSGANASIESKIKFSTEETLSSKRIQNPEKKKNLSPHGKTSMMEFLQKKALKKAL